MRFSSVRSGSLSESSTNPSQVPQSTAMSCVVSHLVSNNTLSPLKDLEYEGHRREEVQRQRDQQQQCGSLVSPFSSNGRTETHEEHHHES